LKSKVKDMGGLGFDIGSRRQPHLKRIQRADGIGDLVDMLYGAVIRCLYISHMTGPEGN
jgi:hypothetical protein